MTPLYRDRDGDLWEVPTDLLRNTETGRLLTYDEANDFFGPLAEEED